MRAPMIVGSDISGGAALAPRSIGTLTPGASRAGRMAFGTFRERLIRVIGRAAFSMPPSAWLLVDMVTRLRTEQAKAADENARLAREIDALRTRLADAEGSHVELSALRDERDAIRGRVAEMLSQLEAI